MVSLNALPPYDEKAVLEKVADGDEQAFSQLFYQYNPLLATVILRFTGSTSLTKDLVQEIFLKVWMSRESLREVNNFKAFLYVMARNQALNAVQKLITQEKHLKNLSIAREEEGTAPWDKKEQEVYFSLLDEAIAQLPAQQQRVFLLSRRERMKRKEIATKMGLSEETVKKYLQLAVLSITAYLKAHLPLLLLILLK